MHQHLREHRGIARATDARRHAVIDALAGGKAQRRTIAELAPAPATALRRLARGQQSPASNAASASAIATLRCLPPVQPIAMVA